MTQKHTLHMGSICAFVSGAVLLISGIGQIGLLAAQLTGQGSTVLSAGQQTVLHGAAAVAPGFNAAIVELVLGMAFVLLGFFLHTAYVTKGKRKKLRFS